MKQVIKRFWQKKDRESESAVPESSRVTDDTLEEHRKEVFAKGRRFVYPVHITKKHIVRNSIIVVAGLIVSFLVVVSVLIYRYQSDGAFIYRVSTIVPFPVSKVGSGYVTYGEYLFLLRSNQNYLQARNTKDSVAPESLKGLRRDALLQAKQNAVVKQLARERGIIVSKEELDRQIELLESFSGGKRRLDEIVGDYYGISTAELRYLIYIQLLKQSLSPVLSVDARITAEAILSRLNDGEDFATLAKELSEDDLSSDNGGSLGLLTSDSQDLPPNALDIGFDLSVGTTSDLIAGPLGFHIVKKVADGKNDTAELAHIFVRYDDIEAIIDRELDIRQTRDYIKF